MKGAVDRVILRYRATQGSGLAGRGESTGRGEFSGSTGEKASLALRPSSFGPTLSSQRAAGFYAGNRVDPAHP